MTSRKDTRVSSIVAIQSRILLTRGIARPPHESAVNTVASFPSTNTQSSRNLDDTPSYCPRIAQIRPTKRNVLVNDAGSDFQIPTDQDATHRVRLTHNGERRGLLKSELEQRLARDLQLLALLGSRNRSATGGTCQNANGSSRSSSRNPSDERA